MIEYVDHDDTAWLRERLETEPAWLIGRALQEIGSSKTFAAYLTGVGTREVAELKLGKKADQQSAEFEALYKELNPYGYSTHPIHFSDLEIDQARAAGVLIEFEHGSPIVTDRKLYRELVKQALARSVDEYRDKAAAAREAKKTQRKTAGAKLADPLAEAKRTHREAIRELADQAHGVNLDLGAALINGLSRVDPNDIDVARFFVLWGCPHRTNYADGPSMSRTMLRRRGATVDGGLLGLTGCSRVGIVKSAEGLEVGEEVVGGRVAAGRDSGWREEGEGAFFDGHVGVDVLLGGAGVGVAEPQGDDGAVDAGLEQRHRAAVAEHVWVHALADKGRAAPCGGGDMGRDTTLDGIARQPTSSSGGEQRILRLSATFAEPDGDNGLGVSGEWNGALLAPFAFDADVGSGAEDDVGTVEGGELGDAKAGVDCEREHRPVAASFPAVLWCGVDQRAGFLAGEVGHGASLEALCRDAEHAGDHGCVFGVAQSGVSEQGADRSEPEVPRSWAVVPVGLEVLKERRDQRLVKVLPVQRRRDGPGAVVREGQQQAHRVAVGGDRARAGVQLLGQAVGEERLQRGGNRCHDRASWAASSIPAAWASSSGAAER